MILKKLISSLFNKLPYNLKEEILLVKKLYTFSFKSEDVRPLVIYSLDNKFFTNGLVDRIRGMVSAYLYAKCSHKEFRIEHELPFRLEEFLIPNQYNWILKTNEKSYNLKKANPVCLFDYTKGKRLIYLPKNRQYHIYSNIDIIPLYSHVYNENFSFQKLYNELFKPSPLLDQAIAKCKQQIPQNYISISFRFMQLLGDFKDAWGKTLSKSEQTLLIDKSLEAVQKLKEENPSYPQILVTADSKKFIEAVQKLPFVYIIPGEIGHIGNQPDENIHLKTFLDFYMISGADYVYLGLSGDMYKSNYARTAAIIGDKPFQIINY